MGNWAMLQALAFEPRKAFLEIAERPRFLFPLLLLILSTAGLSLWYTSVVDMEWLVDRQLRSGALGRQLTEVQIEQQVAAVAGRRGLQSTVGTLGSAFGVLLITLLGAVYYVLAGKVTNVERSFRQWLALNCWSSLPTVLGVIPAAFVLLSADTTQIPQDALQPLSLNALFFHLAPGDPGFALLSSLSLLQFLALYLAALGVKVWSGRSWLFSLVFAGLPFVLVYGLWAFFALR